jgi:hypothetical protein
MSAIGSVTHWIVQLKAGDQAPVGPLWDRYFQRLVGLARKRLYGIRPGDGDGEGIALEAFASLWRGTVQGRFVQLTDRDDLWRLLVVITVRKTIDLQTRQRRKNSISPG